MFLDHIIQYSGDPSWIRIVQQSLAEFYTILLVAEFYTILLEEHLQVA
jgi:hypothetical protein